MNIHELCVRFPTQLQKLIPICLAALLLAGCGTPTTALALIPVAGGALAGSNFEIEEYALVEQSIDNPTHAGFQTRVPDSIRARREGPAFFEPENVILVPNQALAAFGFRLAQNPNPPFGAYALYAGDTLVQADIARFWPVSIKKDGSTAQDFLFAFETLTGEHRMASMAGIQDWPVQGQATETSSPPVYLKGSLAYAAVDSDGLSVIAGSDLLYTGAAGTPRNFYTWGSDHWALELDGRVILDGQDLNELHHYEEVFQWALIDNQPFYFYTRSGLTHLNYAGRDLPYTYDLVVHAGEGEGALFNPTVTEQVVWFYALRDGLWYYVEGRVKE